MDEDAVSAVALAVVLVAAVVLVEDAVLAEVGLDTLIRTRIMDLNRITTLIMVPHRTQNPTLTPRKIILKRSLTRLRRN